MSFPHHPLVQPTLQYHSQFRGTSPSPFIIQLQFKAPAFTSSSKPWQQLTPPSSLSSAPPAPSLAPSPPPKSPLFSSSCSIQHTQTQITPSSAPTATQAEPVLSVSLLVLCRRQICTIRLIPAHHRYDPIAHHETSIYASSVRRRCDLRAQPSPTSPSAIRHLYSALMEQRKRKGMMKNEEEEERDEEH